MDTQSVERKEPVDPIRMSPGERLFDTMNYGVVGGVGNFIISIMAGYSARYGRGAKLAKTIENAVEGHANPALVKDAVMTTALMMGGNAVLPVMLAAEHHKEGLVAAGNRLVGCEENAPLKHNQEHSWGSMIKSRLLAWGMVFGSFRAAVGLAGPKRLDAFEKGFATHVVCNPLGLATHVNGVETAAFKYGRIGALDLFATGAAAGMMYGFSRAFAKEKPTAFTDRVEREKQQQSEQQLS